MHKCLTQAELDKRLAGTFKLLAFKVLSGFLFLVAVF
jgi:hypothetical protein